MTDVEKEIAQGDICQYCQQVFMLPGEGIPRTCMVCLVEEARPDEPIDLDRPKGP